MSQRPGIRPFWGHLSGSARFPKTEDCLEISGQPFKTVTTAAGEVTPLGRTTCRSAHCVTEDGRALNGTMSLTAGDGGELHLTYTAATVEPPPFIVQQSELIIEGGTGRYAKASGRVIGMVFVTFLGYDQPEWPIEVAFAGTITF